MHIHVASCFVFVVSHVHGAWNVVADYLSMDSAFCFDAVHVNEAWNLNVEYLSMDSVLSCVVVHVHGAWLSDLAWSCSWSLVCWSGSRSEENALGQSLVQARVCASEWPAACLLNVYFVLCSWSLLAPAEV